MAAKKKAAKELTVTLHDHIKELRNRLFVVAIIFIVTSAVAYNYKDTLIYYLLKPLGDEKLIYLNPAGGFSFIFQVTMYVGIAITIPFLVFNLYRFVAPALPKSAQRHSFMVMISSLFLLTAGVAFGYLLAIPGALNFLNHFADGYVVPTLTAESYLNFILAYTAGLGILFQLPLVLLFIHWVHPLKPLGLLKFERYMVLIAFVAAAMITPTPDVMNQVIMALPIVVMYQIGFIAICISILRAKRRASVMRKREAASTPIPVAHTLTQTRFPAVVELMPTTSQALKPVAPAVKIPVVSTEPHAAAQTTVPIAPIKPRKMAMDIMVQAPAGGRGQIVRPPRQTTLRPVMPVAVPQRRRPIISSGKMASIDGMSVF